MFYNLKFEKLVFENEFDENTYSYYAYGLVIMMALSLCCTIYMISSVMKAFETFTKTKFDMIRNNVSTDMYLLQRDHTTN